MGRDFSALGRDPFDVLVIGGGIFGAWIAYDAALRGCRVALVERTDWGAGTSSASSKLVHGGLRYLEHLQLRLVRTSLHERRRLTRLAPHRVRPVRFALPVYRQAPVGRFRWKLGLMLYDFLAGRDQPVAPHRALSVAALRDRCPFLRPDGLVGGYSYGDCQTDDARFALEIVDGARQAGVAAVNHAAVTRLLKTGGRVAGAEVQDGFDGSTLEIQATVTVDCRAAWSPLTTSSDGPSAAPARLTKGVHLVLPALATDLAVLLQARADGRAFFLLPWYGRTLLGTTDTPYESDPDRVRVEASDVSYLLEAANAYLTRPWLARDVVTSFAGLRVLRNDPGVDPSRVTREWSLDQPQPGLLVPMGGKYSTARADAAKAVDEIQRLTGRPVGACPTTTRAFPWAPAGDFDRWLADHAARGIALGLDELTARTAACRFGNRLDELHRRIEAQPHLATRVHPELPFCRAEVLHAVAAEMALTLEDVMRRRVPLSILTRPDPTLAADVATLVGPQLGWTAQRQRDEVAQLLSANPGLPDETP